MKSTIILILFLLLLVLVGSCRPSVEYNHNVEDSSTMWRVGVLNNEYGIHYVNGITGGGQDFKVREERLMFYWRIDSFYSDAGITSFYRSRDLHRKLIREGLMCEANCDSV